MRRDIAAAVARLFEEHGYFRVPMVDISEVAEVSEQTLYNYFPPKEHRAFDLDQEYEGRIVALVVEVFAVTLEEVGAQALAPAGSASSLGR